MQTMRRRDREAAGAESDDTLNIFAVMAGVKRNSLSTRFRGGEVTAVMGGDQIDLRQATIAPGEEAVLDIFTVMGGCEIFVPPSWTVATPIVPVMGGIDDKRIAALPGALDSTRRQAGAAPGAARPAADGRHRIKSCRPHPMHPILARLERLAAYLALWCAIGVLVGVVLTRQGLSWPEALVQVLPPLLVYSFVCLSAWYVCRAMPLTTSGVAGSADRLGGGGRRGRRCCGWSLNEVWIAHARIDAGLAPITSRFRGQTPFLFAVSVMLFLLVLSVHYVVLAFEALRTAERQQLELQVLTRDAELRALRAQLDPHFLYNSLNSISALTGSDPAAARRMCLLLAEFLRTTLRVSAQERIPLAEELALADRFLSIEQVRFGSRLQVERHDRRERAECRVPPLVLQPLLENAVGHGIAGLIDGGTIRLDVARHGDRAAIAVENPRDPDALPRTRGGVGLENVRQRLADRVRRRGAHGRHREPHRLPRRHRSALYRR